MRQIYISLLTFILATSTGFITPLFGQYYIELEKDASGFDTAPFQADLNAAAQELCQLFDSLGFEGQFKVFSAGFYTEQEFFKDYGYSEVFESLKAQAAAESSYYLLIGRESNSNVIMNKFWITLQFPDTGQLSCITNLQRAVYIKRVEKQCVDKYSESKDYRDAEIAGMKEYKKIMYEILNCCVVNKNDMIGKVTGCDGCSDDLARQYFQLQGFEKVNLSISTAAFANINTAKVKDYSFHKVTVGAQTDYLGEIMGSQVQKFNQWFSFNLLVTSYPSLCIDSISGSNLDAFKYKEDFNCQISFPSGEGLKPSDIKITWNKKAGSWIKDASTANLIANLLRCKINRFLGLSSDDCFNVLSIPPWTANMTDMPQFDFFYAVYVNSLNAGVSIFDLIEGYKDFGGSEAAADPDPEIQNGIDIVSTSVAFSVPTTGSLIGRSRRNPPNVEDIQHGTKGNCNGIIHDCMICFRFYNPSVPCRELSEEDLEEYMTSLMTFFSKDPLENIAVSFAERFFNKVSSDHYSTELSEHVRNSPNMRNYMKLFGAALNERLKANGGNIYLNPIIEMPNNIRPVFGGSYNRWHGLTILLNDTEMTDIWYMGNFTLDNNTKIWSADLYFEVTDHFGLDKHDAIAFQDYHIGFAAWWALQHRKDYPPFRTKITIFATLKGKL